MNRPIGSSRVLYSARARPEPPLLQLYDENS